MKKFTKILNSKATVETLIFLALTVVIFVSGCKKEIYNFANGYDNLNGKPSGYFTDTLDYTVNTTFYPQARIFPGLVSTTQKRIADTSITFNLNYSLGATALLSGSNTPQPIFSTGLFDPAGELIEIDVPAGIYGLTVRVGSQTDNLTALSSLRRTASVSTVQALFPGVNTIRNLFGGYIWILASNPVAAPVSISFKRAVSTSDFILGTTTSVAAWEQQVTASGVPWLELRSQHAAFSVSRQWVLQGIQNGTLNSIDKTLAEWDQVITQDFYHFFGLTAAQSPVLPERFVMDVQLANGGNIENGEPIRALSSAYFFDEWTDYNTLSTGNSYYTYQQLASNYSSLNATIWWTTVAPSVLNLNVFKTAFRNGVGAPTLSGLGTQSLSNAMPVALGYANSGKGKFMDIDTPTKGVTVKLVPFLQLFAKIHNPSTGESGFDFLTDLLISARATGVGADDMSKRDFFFTALCNFTQTDYSRFFDAWGIPVNTSVRSAVAQKYPPLTDPIWLYNPITQQYITDQFPTRLKRIYYDRVNWQIVASDEALNEGAANITTAMLDGDPNTYWHACYSGCSPLASPVPPPHIINIDMGQTNKLSGVYVESRNGNRQPTEIALAVSSDNINWTSVGDYNLPQNADPQYFTFPQALSARYLRFTLNKNSYDNTPYSAVAELGAYYDGN
jgi:hypothetical protein